MPKTTCYPPPGNESTVIQVHGSSGTQLNAKDPLPPIASREEVEATKNHVLETFYPISPTISLQECHIYDVNDEVPAGYILIPFKEELCLGNSCGKPCGKLRSPLLIS